MYELFEATKKKNLLQVKKIKLTDHKLNFAIGLQEQRTMYPKYTPLTYACLIGDIRIVKYLLENKAKVNGVPDESYTPLYAACVSGKKEIVDFLLEKKAKVNKVNKSGMSAVFGCVEKDNVDLIKYLETKGADLTVKCQKGGLVRHATFAHNAPKCLSYFTEKKLEVDTYDEPSGQSTLYELALSFLYYNTKDEKKKISTLDSMKKLIDSGADPNLLSKREDREETPLHLACKYSNDELITFLLDNGADPNSKSKRDDTPLLSLFFLKREPGSTSRKVVTLKSLEKLFQHKADPNMANTSGITPFLYLMSTHVRRRVKDDIKLVEMFLDHGADLKSVDFKGNTPLHLAAAKAFAEACKVMINRKADVNAENSNKETPFFSVARCIDSSTASKETWELLLANGAKIQKNSDGDYPHFVASKRNRVRIILCMIANGVKSNTLDQEGNTFMHLLAKDYENKEDGTSNTADLKYINDIIGTSAKKEHKLHLKNNDGNNFYDIILPKLNESDKTNLEATLKKKGYDINETEDR